MKNLFLKHAMEILILSNFSNEKEGYANNYLAQDDHVSSNI